MSEYKTGDSAPESGKYHWVGMEDNSSVNAPSSEMQELDLDKGDPFPPVSGKEGKGVWKQA